MKRTELRRRTPLRSRSTLWTTARLARSVRPSVRKTRVGEFSPKTRRLLLERFDRRCAACGDFLPPTGWTAQHRRARGAGGSHDPLTVCPANGVAIHQIPCHERIEANPAQALRDGFRVPQGTAPQDFPIRIWTGTWGYLTKDGGWRPVAAEPEESV